jgi:hypothetical protein
LINYNKKTVFCFFSGWSVYVRLCLCYGFSFWDSNMNSTYDMVKENGYLLHMCCSYSSNVIAYEPQYIQGIWRHLWPSFSWLENIIMPFFLFNLLLGPTVTIHEPDDVNFSSTSSRGADSLIYRKSKNMIWPQNYHII